MVELRNVEKTFVGQTAVHPVSLQIDEGEFLTFLGPSGCGKTTLLRMIAGLEQPTQGDVYLEGKCVTWVPPYRRDVNLVFQNYALFPHMTVEDNIGFGLRMKRVPAAEQKRRIVEVLQLTQLEALSSRFPQQLSGGQQQRVAIARAIVGKPKVLLLDEPLAALDLQLRKSLQLELKQLQHRLGITFVYVTHDQEEAMTLSDRIIVMNGGRVEQIGTPEHIYAAPQSLFVASFIGENNIFRQGERPFAVRPEKLRLIGPESAQAKLRGTIEEVVYAGNVRKLWVRLEKDQTLVLAYRYEDGAAPAKGTVTGLTWHSGDEVTLQR
jgi:spermidine/putrescine transport system ATP-binding protein